MKRVSITPEILAKIKASTGADVDPNTIAVFETISLDTSPISKPGSIWDKATNDLSMLAGMASYVNGGGDVPIHTLHQSRTELPVGRTFYAEVFGNELRSLFFIPNDKAQFASDIDTGVINNVSVGAMPKVLACSTCGWDFYGPEASFMNFLDRTCGNGHVIGDDGAHLSAQGFGDWFEQSLVGRGASTNAKILGRSRQKLAADTISRLAANGIPPEAHILVKGPKGEDEMPKELLDRLEAQSGEITTLKAAATAHDGAVADLNTKLTAATGQVTDLTAQLATANTTAARVPELETQLTASKTTNDATVAFLRTHAERALTATGKKATDLPADADAAKLMSVIEECQTNLVNLFEKPAALAARDTGLEASGDARSSFKTARS